MSVSGIDKRWIKLKAYSDQIGEIDSASNLNNNEFIIASSYNSSDYDGIHKYNMHKNEWETVLKYPDDTYILMEIITVAEDLTGTKIYLGEWRYQEWKIFDMKSKNLSKINSDYEVKCNTSMVNVNGIFHILGGNDDTRHVTWDTCNDEVKEIHDFIGDFRELRCPSSIHVPSQQIILSIGAEDSGNHTMVGIWKFCINSSQWQKMMEFEYCNPSICLTSDERYVIIGGGDDANGHIMNKLYALDIREEDKYKLIECNIKLPAVGAYQIARTGGGLQDEILVIGWIKQEFKKNDFNDLLLPPMYIMQMIALWYNQEMIHWVCGDGEQEKYHYCIKLKHILSSLV